MVRADDLVRRQRKRAVWEAAQSLAPAIPHWQRINRYFHEEDAKYLRFLVPEGLRVLELGCGSGWLLDQLAPREGVGVDFSPAMIEQARANYPRHRFLVGDVEDEALIETLVAAPFEVILIADTIGVLEDVQITLDRLHRLCSPRTRLIIAYHSVFWFPILKLAERLRLKMPSLSENWLGSEDIANLLRLSGFEEVFREWRQLLPKRLFGLGPLVNRFVATLPLVRGLCVRNYVVARSLRAPRAPPRSVSVVIPCRNERGNIEPAIRRLPRLADDQEVIFVEGHSRDGTLAEIDRVIAANPELDIKVAVQGGRGKGDAVRKGFDLARGDVLIILDADLTVPPEDLPKFVEVFVANRAEFANGSRLVYPIEDEAMRFLNLIANQLFAWLFSFLLNQRFTDTLCGTKVLWRSDYQRIAAGRSYFGEFDPFGDFDLIFGAAKLNLKIVEVPIRYRARSYGETQISRFRHGLLLARMAAFAWRKMRAF